MTEIWKAIPGFEGHYEASSAGRVRGVDRIVPNGRGGVRSVRGRLLKQRPTDRGYLVVMMCKHGEYRPRLVHRLVLKAFAGDSDLECRHLNGVQTDNRIDNLAWGTGSENALDQVEHGTHHHARKTHCPRGHEYTAENTATNRRGARLCKTCRKITWDAWYARKKVSA